MVMSIGQGRIDDHGLSSSYASVKPLRRQAHGDATRSPVIETAPGEEGQVEYGG